MLPPDQLAASAVLDHHPLIHQGQLQVTLLCFVQCPLTSEPVAMPCQQDVYVLHNVHCTNLTSERLL